MNARARTILGYFAHGLPLAATLLVLGILATIVLIVLVGGIPALSWEFLSTGPRNANTEGGILPAIIGTVFLVFIMTIAAVPIGTITAIYLAEYADQTSWYTKAIRFAVNSLASVPSIVFGLFGLGFFIQTVGAGIDSVNYDRRMDVLEQQFEASPSPFADGKMASIAQVRAFMTSKRGWDRELRSLTQFPGGAAARVKPEQVVEYLSERPDLQWGRPNVLWAALTLALLTLPVVIVSVEEALRAVPADVRAASLALGATKWETIRKIVLPNSLTGIMTGSILAVGRGAGEVAPILFTGVAYTLHELPGIQDRFMHLGYHLYMLATQSLDVEKTRPLQLATTIVLLGLTLTLNLVAIVIRSRIRRNSART